jgi:hypothetical protein
MRGHENMMRAWRQCLLMVLGGWALVGAAQAGEHIDWFDDGTVLLKLGPTYDDAVIETSRGELGSLFGPGAQPFAGAIIHVLTLDEGPKGAISGPLTAWAPVFEELSGAKVELELVPVTNLYSTMMLDLQRGTGRYDAAVVAAYFYGELIGGNFLRSVDDLAVSGKFPRWTYDTIPGAIRQLYTWEGKGYGVPKEDYLKAYHATYVAPTMLSYLRIRGTPDYRSVLDSELAAAVGRRKAAQQALDDVAAAWERITDRLGRQRQLELYRDAIGYPHGPGGSGDRDVGAWTLATSMCSRRRPSISSGWMNGCAASLTPKPENPAS